VLRLHVPYVQYPRYRFTIGRQESQLGDIRIRYAGQELPIVRVLVAGCWGSAGSLLSDLTENVRFEHRRGVPSSTSLWGAIAKAIPPELLREMLEWQLALLTEDDSRMSQWMINLEWNEEGITGHWQITGTAVKWPEAWSVAKASDIVVDTLS
jgi:hypothetical protein